MMTGIVAFFAFASYYEETGNGFLLMAAGLGIVFWSGNELTKDCETSKDE